jgi:integrase
MAGLEEAAARPRDAPPLLEHRRRASVAVPGFHDLRRTAATLMLKKRLPVKVVSKVLGHSDPAMTLRRYALPDMQEIAAIDKEEYAVWARKC